MPEWLTHPITISIVTVIIAQIILNAFRNYVLTKKLDQNARELEAELQESEERLRILLKGFEENRRDFAESLKKINALGETPPDEPQKTT